MPFTPLESIAGGLIMGASVCFHSLFLGRISGEACALHSTVLPVKARDQPQEWLQRFMYILGIVIVSSVVISYLPFLSSLALNRSYPWKSVHGLYAFLTHPLILFPVAGFIVGFSQFFTRGETSSHMLWGVGAVRIRSLIASVIFVLSAFVMSKLFRTVDNMMRSYEPGTAPGTSHFIAWPSIMQALAVLLAVVGVYSIYLGIWSLAEGWGQRQYQNLSADENPVTFNVLSFFNGSVLALGMGVSGMTKPQKVLGAFDVFGPWFDPSLLFTVMAVVGVNLIANNTYILDRKERGNAPVFANDFRFGSSEPPLSSLLDWRLMMGSLIFGIGWGMTGILPGTAIVSLAGSGNGEMVIFFASLVTGMLSQSLISMALRGHFNISMPVAKEEESIEAYEAMNEMEFQVASA